MEIIFLVISAFIAGFLSAFLVIDEKFIKKIKSSKNHVHFYVARNSDGMLWLYIGKPRLGMYSYREIEKCERIGGIIDFPDFGLDENDYDELKFGDEPVEVFIKMED